MQRRGFTLIELMVVIAVTAILLTLAAPSMYDFIVTQRLKAIHAQINTDLQWARSEALARGVPVHVTFSQANGDSCYLIYTGPAKACTCPITQTCKALPGVNELRSVQVPDGGKVLIEATANNEEYPLNFDSVTGLEIKPVSMKTQELSFTPSTGTKALPVSDNFLIPVTSFSVDTLVDNARALRTVVGPSGRPTSCAPSGSTMSEKKCP
jgi:type IV fimbrial biogenesis protein FimT